MNKNIKAFLILAFCELAFFPTVHATDQNDGIQRTECESALFGMQQNPDILAALKTFPIGYNDKMGEEFKSALAHLPATLETVDLNFFSGGVDLPFDLQKLVGFPVAGLFDRGPSIRGPEYKTTAELEANYTFQAGVIKDVKSNHNKADLIFFVFTLQTEQGLLEVTHMQRDDRHMLHILKAKESPEENLRQAFNHAQYTQWLEASFTAPLQPLDFEVAKTALEIYLELPPGYGIPATVNTLRGQKEITRNHPKYGLLHNDKRYTAARLDKFLRYAQAFMRGQGFERPETFNTREDIQMERRNFTPLVSLFMALIDQENKMPAITLEAKKDRIFTIADYAKAATAQVDFSVTENSMESLMTALQKENIEDVTLSHLKYSKRLKLFSKSKGSEGPVHLYIIENPRSVRLDLQIHNTQAGRNVGYWIDVDPIVKVSFGSSPAQILKMEYSWTIGTRRLKNEVEIIPMDISSVLDFVKRFRETHVVTR